MSTTLPLLLLMLISSARTQDKTTIVNQDHQRCPQKIHRMEVLPGQGWDSLRNKAMGNVLHLPYNQCRTTEDGQYLIPDDVYITPVKKSDLELTSELIEHWANYSSLTARSFKLNAGGNLFGVDNIQGSFDSDFQTTKRHQVEEKAMTTRVQARITMYTVQASPSARIDPNLKKVLNDAMEAVEKKQSEKARVLLEFVVRDYGTHYVTQADAGAILVQEDCISRNFVIDSESNRNNIKAAAGANFFGKFGFKTEYDQKVDNTFTKQYLNSKTSTRIRAMGGGIVRPNMSLNQWIDEIPNNLIFSDRSGNPLSYLIAPWQFPNVTLRTVSSIRTMMDKVISDYYAYNSHYGCMDMSSASFDYNANIDDGSCRKQNFNFTFGGIYQTCSDSICGILAQKNPLTNAYSCPPNYISLQLVNGNAQRAYYEDVCSTSCSGWWLWKKCKTTCTSVQRTRLVYYQGYWCAAVGTVSANTGYMFGGLYSSWRNNPVTKDQSCPKTFIPLYLSSDLKICVSDDYVAGSRYSVPFGGLYSCLSGNPLAMDRSSGKLKGSYVQACPNGYTQHMAIADNNCEINYCMAPFGQYGQMDIVLPPFRDQSSLFMVTASLSNISPATVENTTSLTGWGIAGIVIGCLVGIVLFVGVIMKIRKRRSCEQLPVDEERQVLVPDEVSESTNNYQSVNDNNSAVE